MPRNGGLARTRLSRQPQNQHDAGTEDSATDANEFRATTNPTEGHPPRRLFELHLTTWPDSSIPLLIATVARPPSARTRRALLLEWHTVFRGFSFCREDDLHVSWCDNAYVHHRTGNVSIVVAGVCIACQTIQPHALMHAGRTCVVGIAMLAPAANFDTDIEAALFQALHGGEAIVAETPLRADTLTDPGRRKKKEH